MNLTAGVRWICALFLLQLVAYSQLPPIRSTKFDGRSNLRISFPSAPYIPSFNMTVEAWVYRDDANRCETILSQDFTQSFWFGFCGGSLRFYRSGGAFADADRNVPANRWTHVAAVFIKGPPAQVSFFIDGQLVATKSLAAVASGHELPLYLGGDPNFTGYPLKGALDEVRLWSVARSADQIRTNRFAELTGEESLVAVFPSGGRREAVSGYTATLPAGAVQQIVGILPRDLVVPRTTRTILGDASPSAEEYAGAEQMIVRYLDGPNEVDAVASLIMRQRGAESQTNLWVGITFPELRSSPFGFTGGAIRLFCDRNASGDTVPQTNDLRFDYTVFTAAPAQSGWHGNGSGDFVADAFFSGTGGFKPTSGFCASEFAPACIEMALLKSWAAASNSAPEIRFMLDLFKPGSKGVVPPVSRSSPLDAVAESPATWPLLRFGDFVDVPSSEVRLRVAAFNSASGGGSAGVAGATITLRDNRSLAVLDRRETLSAGIVDFAVTVARNVPLRVDIEPPTAWEVTGAFASGPGDLGPTSNTLTYVIYPGCANTTCTYRDWIFQLRAPPGQSRFTGAAETTYWPQITLREGASPKLIPPTTVTLQGTNLHERMRVWAFDGGTILLPTGVMNEPPGPPTTSRQHYFQLPVTDVAADGRSLTVRMELAENQGDMQFWVRDDWDRPARDRYWHAAGGVSRAQPPFELLHSFPWENVGDGHDIDDYRMAFPGLVCDPFKMVGFWAWFPIYLLALDGGGECVGMCATADQLTRFRQTEPFNSLVHYTAGFPMTGFKPAHFDVGNICAPSAANVWGQVRGNHGVQLSAEFIGETISQLRFDAGIYAVMNDQLTRLRTGSGRKLICFREGLFDGGHGVLALAVRDTGTNLDGTPNPDMRDVVIYDPNWPEQTKILHLNVVNNRFYYDGFNPPWVGGMLAVHNVREFWEVRPRNLISVDSLGVVIDQLGVRGLVDLFAMLVSGEARPMVTTGPGQQIGRNADGTRVETAPDAVSVPSWGYVPGGPAGPSQIFLKPRPTPPQLDVQLDGGKYAMNVMHLGHMFQLFVEGGAKGETDRVNFGQDGTNLVSFQFTPQNLRSKVTPRLAIAENGSNYVASFSWDGLQVPGGKSAGIRAFPDRRGAELANDTGLPLQPRISVVTPDPGGVQTNEFGPFNLPAGAAHRALLASADGKRLRTETDLNRDGVPEFIAFVVPGIPDPASPPALEALPAGGLVQIRWKLTSGEWALEQTDELGAGANWSAVSAVPELAGENSVVMLPAEATARFVRLRAR